MEATMIDFRNRMSDIQAAISRRERVTVSSHGRPWAVVIAWDDAERKIPRARDLAAAGMWAGRDDLADPTAYVRSLRERRTFV